MSDPVPAVSPTGAPTLSQRLIKLAIPFFGLTAAIASLPTVLQQAGITLPDIPWVHAVVGVSAALTALGISLGIASQGARKDAAVAAGAAAAASPGEALNK